jgi:hypothetical protein
VDGRCLGRAAPGDSGFWRTRTLVCVDQREYFHDDSEFSELWAAVVVRVLLVFNKSGKSTVSQLVYTAMPYLSR